MKKIIPIFLAVILIAGMVFARSAIAEEDSAVFSAGKVSGSPGETVVVDVKLSGNPGIVSLKVMVEFDTDKLELISAEGADYAGVSFGPLTDSPVAVNWVDSIHPNNMTNGTVAKLTFMIRDGAETGKTKISLSYDPEDVYNADFENVRFDIISGEVNIKKTSAFHLFLTAGAVSKDVPGESDDVRCILAAVYQADGELLLASAAPRSAGETEARMELDVSALQNPYNIRLFFLGENLQPLDRPVDILL